MNKYEDDFELAQAVHNIAKESCEECTPEVVRKHTPDVVRKEIKWAAYILSVAVAILGGGNLLVLNLINNKADLTNTKIDGFYDVITEVKIMRHDQEIIKTDVADLKKNVDLNNVQIVALRNEVRNIKNSNIVENQ